MPNTPENKKLRAARPALPTGAVAGLLAALPQDDSPCSASTYVDAALQPTVDHSQLCGDTVRDRSALLESTVSAPAPFAGVTDASYCWTAEDADDASAPALLSVSEGAQPMESMLVLLLTPFAEEDDTQPWTATAEDLEVFVNYDVNIATCKAAFTNDPAAHVSANAHEVPSHEGLSREGLSSGAKMNAADFFAVRSQGILPE